ncbi:MAG: (2,3-dihydroxybenzoyl)adenylate synthase [Solirubrobacteraceae bacterium]|nr:(2,3-dihydroxybenzoyl)adenylate synthase [Patulibacter sp.]
MSARDDAAAPVRRDEFAAALGPRPSIDVVGSPEVPTWPVDVAAGYRDAGYWTGETFGQMLRTRALEHGGREAVVGGGQRWTYDELDRRADELAGGLARLGVRRGDRVVVQLPNEPVFLEVLLGCLRRGAVPVMALPAHRSSELLHFARHSEAVALITTGRRAGCDHAALAEEVQAGAPFLREVIVDDPAPRPGQRALDDLRGDGLDPDAHWLPNGPDLALLQLSGGTTGLSKLIPRTHDDYRYSVQVSAEVCGFGPQTRYLCALPAAHNFPLSSPGTLGTLWAGGTVVMCPSPDPRTALDLIAAERITVTGIVPPLALAWLDALSGGTWDTSSLELLQVGGAKLDADVAARIEPAFGARLQQVFGMAEGLVNYTRPEDSPEVTFRTQGRPMSPGDEVRVVDEAGQPVAPGEAGALQTRGPYTIRGYYRAPEHNATAFTDDGFYVTGDLVEQTPSGHLTVVGRAKEQINRGGEKVAPGEVEHHLLAHPDVVDACVIGLPDPQLGERTCAVLLTRGAPPTAASVRRFVRERGVAAFKVPDRVAFVDAFPTTGVGKVSRRDLRALLTAQLLAPAGEPAHPEPDVRR